MNMFKKFTDNLKKELIQVFGILDSNYVCDVLDDAAFDLESDLNDLYEVRFGLFKKSGVELKTSVLFQTEKAADEMAKLTDARVGMVLVPTK